MTKKVYLGLVTDHSGSMRSVSNYAINDLNSIIGSYKSEVDSSISVLVTEFQIANSSKRVLTGVNVNEMLAYTHYSCSGIVTGKQIGRAHV